MKNNILILSVGTRNKIVEYFKKEANENQQVFATDNSPLAPALYVADDHFIVPKIDDPNYIFSIIKICISNDIGIIFSLIDSELLLLAENKELLLENGVMPIISCSDIVELSFDKFHMFNKLNQHSINTPLTFVSIEDFSKALEYNQIEFPVFVKPRKGSASIDIGVVESFDELLNKLNKSKNLIIQEYVQGKEFGADVYIDLISGDVVDIFVKEKIRMRAGETDKSISVDIPEITNLIREMLTVINFKGVIDIDIFERNGIYYISEVNPRFGGGYPHAYESGMNIPKMIINNYYKNINEPNVGRKFEKNVMLKFNEIKIVKIS